MIVAGVDGSVPSRAAVAWAAADAHRMHEPLLLVHALDRAPYQIAGFANAALPDSVLRAGRKVLNEALALVHERRPTVEVSTRTVEGAAAPALCDLAGEATELVVGSRGRGALAGALLGSVSDHVAGEASCPVVVVRGELRPCYGQVVAGVDDSPASGPALAYAFEQAALRDSTLRILHSRTPAGAGQPPAVELLETLQKKYPQVTVIEQAFVGHPVDASGEADLLVVGSRGRGSALLGSVGRGVLHHARCPVAVVRAT
ncbi:universal stress protein [Nonomuraea gerenzanensis]|uniref:Universal stress protein family n=1 Tax=Nonomuraea gerenzanensis TaxID=93944 RepID=A0A1M4EN63_9ACTN|nr:universal stress protein [Nonomuraea gerenzanensis]UBU11524.1 universal stress protein [Nonomuraea gerenzanensis]SBP00013.1 Universal stress protein family [Nonomuraea gerenzanensis]